MSVIYKDLFQIVKAAFPNEKLLWSVPIEGVYYNEFSQLSRLTPFDGEDFPTDDGEFQERYFEPAVRLMVIGRNKVSKKKLIEKTAYEFSENTTTKIHEQFMTPKPIDSDCFPEYPKNIIEKLKPISSIGDKWDKDNKWYEHILWYDPFVFEFPNNTVENNKLQNFQLSLCRKLLCYQLKFFRPNHILFIPGSEKFTDAFNKDEFHIEQIMTAF